MMKAFLLLFVGMAHEVVAFNNAQMPRSQTKTSEKTTALQFSDTDLLEDEICQLCHVLRLTDFNLVAKDLEEVEEVEIESTESSATELSSLDATPEVDERSERIAARAAIAAEFMQNNGFHGPVRHDLIADDFVFMGPTIGPLNKRDYIGTLGIFKVYEAFPDIKLNAATFTQDPKNPDRFWSFIRVTGTHYCTLDLGSKKYDPTYLGLRGGPEAVSVTFDEDDKIKTFTAGYVTDAREGKTGMAGAMFAILTSIGASTPRPGGKTFKALNWIGNKKVDYPKSVSHTLDLPQEWAAHGREHGKRTADAWATEI